MPAIFPLQGEINNHGLIVSNKNLTSDKGKKATQYQSCKATLSSQGWPGATQPTGQHAAYTIEMHIRFKLPDFAQRRQYTCTNIRWQCFDVNSQFQHLIYVCRVLGPATFRAKQYATHGVKGKLTKGSSLAWCVALELHCLYGTRTLPNLNHSQKTRTTHTWTHLQTSLSLASMFM